MLRVGSLSYSEIAERVGCCIDTVSFVRKLYDIEHIPINNFEKTSITVEQYTLDGKYVQSFKSFREAGRWLIANGHAKQSYDGGVSQHIGSVCMGKRKSCVWVSLEKINLTSRTSRNHVVVVVKYPKLPPFIRIFQVQFLATTHSGFCTFSPFSKMFTFSKHTANINFLPDKEKNKGLEFSYYTAKYITIFLVRQPIRIRRKKR